MQERFQGKIGIMGGSFNPIHIGHLRSAEEVREAFGLSRVIFIPSAEPPHKGKRGMLDIYDRLELVTEAVRDNPFFSASDIEARRDGKSYTVDTLKEMRGRLESGGELFFILGLDAFLEIETWYSFRDLFLLSHFIVTDRPTSTSSNPPLVLPDTLASLFEEIDGRTLRHPSGNLVYYHNISALDISATEIRRLVGERLSIRYLVPDRVNDIITQKGHYL
ncbi:MAG: nicotinate (nicotinamide) nucleotide adenylyltransferase [Deltaproteobacteria bacterium]|nr:nicotinate (nicotinamide) nucleotide adenylyltransferase [Candidatus Zymogenaceae bacterium]